MSFRNIYKLIVIVTIFLTIGIASATFIRGFNQVEHHIRIVATGDTEDPFNKYTILLPPRRLSIAVIAEEYPIEFRILKVSSDNLGAMEPIFEITINKYKIIELDIETRGIYILQTTSESTNKKVKVDLYLAQYGLEKDLLELSLLSILVTIVLIVFYLLYFIRKSKP